MKYLTKKVHFNFLIITCIQWTINLYYSTIFLHRCLYNKEKLTDSIEKKMISTDLLVLRRKTKCILVSTIVLESETDLFNFCPL